MEKNPYTLAWEAVEQDPRFINLIDSHFSDNGYRLPQSLFVEALQAYLDGPGYHPDSRGLESARQALALHYRRQPFQPSPGDFQISAGSSESYSLIFRLFGHARGQKKKARVMLPRPSYPLFEEILDYCGLDAVHYQLDPKQDFALDRELLEAAWDPSCRFLVLISPNNPTGRVCSPREWQILANFCRERKLGLIVDEVFFPYLAPGLNHRVETIAALAPDLESYTLNGISKLCAAPDWKLGWILLGGPDKEQRARTLELAYDNFLNVGGFSQFLLPRLLAAAPALQEQIRRDLDRNHASLQACLAGCTGVRLLPREGGIHGILQIQRSPALLGELDDEALAIQLLEMQHLGLHPGYFYDLDAQEGPSNAESSLFLVLTYLKEPEIFQVAAQRLARALGCTEGVLSG